jgi:DNA-binding MarR family transcriptional regulator
MSRSSLPVLPCLCSSLRRAARGLTQVYEEALRPLGLRVTQFTVLQVLALAGEVSQGRLGEMLAMDSTSLTRTLAIMVRQGWIAERRGADRRERLLRLSEAGAAQLNIALPAWEEVQARLRGRIGEQAWTGLQQLTYEVASVATTHTTHT